MKIIPSKVHGILDYITVIFVFASPALFNMKGELSIVTYVLAAVQLVLSILTAYSLGLVKLIPFRIHGLIEMIASIALAALAFWFLNNNNETGFYFYIILAVVYLVVFVLTDFKESISVASAIK